MRKHSNNNQIKMNYLKIAFIKLIVCGYINMILNIIKANNKWIVIKSNEQFV